MTADEVAWKDFCKRLSAAMRLALEHRVTLEEVSLIIDEERTLTDPDVKGYLQYIIWESGGSPGLYRDMVELLEAGTSEAELARYYNAKQEGAISRLKSVWRRFFGRP
jgi:hypothetical protein